MTEKILNLFISKKNRENEADKRKAYGSVTSAIGIGGNILLATIKLIAGLLSASVAIMADAFNNLSDAGSSLITLISFKLSSKPADKDHPFGHARMEYIASMVVSFIILLVGFELFSSSGKLLLGITESEAKTLTLVPIIILSVSIALKLLLGIFYLRAAKIIDSSVIKAAAMDSFSDTLSTTAVLISTIVIKLTDWYMIDAIVGIAVSVLIIVAGLKILNETKNALLGEAPVEETVDAIKKVVARYPAVIGIHDLMVHNYGPKNFIASLHAEVDGKDDIYELHDMIDNVERQIKNELGILCTIHMDPIVTDDETCNELRSFLIETMSELGYNYDVHDFRVVVGNTHTNLIFDIVVPFDVKISEGEIVETVSRAVNKKRNECFCVITVDRG